jgi:hypothetical protein
MRELRTYGSVRGERAQSENGKAPPTRPNSKIPSLHDRLLYDKSYKLAPTT